MSNNLVAFATSDCVLKLNFPTCSVHLSPTEISLLGKFRDLLRTSFCFLLEFAATRFERRHERENLWRLRCALVRNELLLSVPLFCLADRADWLVNSFDHLFEHPERSYDSRHFGSCLEWLQKVKLFFKQANLLLTVISLWEESPWKYPSQLPSHLPRDSLYDDFFFSYFRGVVRHSASR